MYKAIEIKLKRKKTQKTTLNAHRMEIVFEVFIAVSFWIERNLLISLQTQNWTQFYYKKQTKRDYNSTLLLFNLKR